MEITSGIASPSACGHEITSTATALITAKSTSPRTAQTTKAVIAAPTAT